MIYIIRHGQTELNNAGIMQGHSDQLLNEAGIEQAKEAARWFEKRDIYFSHVFASPLQRAFETAKIVSGGSTEIIVDKRLIEMDYGPYEGTNLNDPPPELIKFFSDFQNVPAPIGMEPLSSVVERTGNFMESIKQFCDAGNILIATHAIAIKGILSFLTPDSESGFWKKPIHNCDIFRTDVVDGVYLTPEEMNYKRAKRS